MILDRGTHAGRSLINVIFSEKQLNSIAAAELGKWDNKPDPRVQLKRKGPGIKRSPALPWQPIIYNFFM